MARLYKKIVDGRNKSITLYYGDEKDSHTITLLPDYPLFDVVINANESDLPKYMLDFEEYKHILTGEA